jgi:hypothetical protein
MGFEMDLNHQSCNQRGLIETWWKTRQTIVLHVLRLTTRVPGKNNKLGIKPGYPQKGYPTHSPFLWWRLSGWVFAFQMLSFVTVSWAFLFPNFLIDCDHELLLCYLFSNCHKKFAKRIQMVFSSHLSPTSLGVFSCPQTEKLCLEMEETEQHLKEVSCGALHVHDQMGGSYEN